MLISRKNFRFCVIAVSVIALCNISKIGQIVAINLLIWQESPDLGSVHSVINESNKPESLVYRFWDTKRIPHRYIAISYLKDNFNNFPDFFNEFDRLLQESTVSVDNNVKEIALGILSYGNNGLIDDYIIKLLNDADSELKLFTLRYLNSTSNHFLIPEIANLLNDQDLKVGAAAASLLRTWTGNDFGVRFQDVVTNQYSSEIQQGVDGGLAKLRFGIGKWKKWWSEFADEYEPNDFKLEEVVPSKILARDFQLEDLKGDTIRLSDFRGKTVILNFWTSWCTACAIEIPDLIELKNRNGDDLIILSISLDGAYGHGANLRTFIDDGTQSSDTRGEAGLAEGDFYSSQSYSESRIRKKLTRLADKLQLNFSVLMDFSGDIGNRFNGQELPTNVLIDKEGYVRRRFLGSRRVDNWELVLSEIQ